MMSNNVIDLIAEWKFGLAKLIRNMQRTYVAPTPLNLFTTWMVLIRKRYLELKADRFRAKMKFRRTMRDEIMQKAPGMRFSKPAFASVSDIYSNISLDLLLRSK